MQETPKKIAVVILNWNGQFLLEKFLPSVISYSDDATIYVADNASSDDSIHFLKRDYPTVKIIQNAKNYGFAKGYNEALKQVPEDILVLLNSDVEVTPNWLQPALDIFERSPQTAAVQPKILDYKNKSMFEYAGAAGGFIDSFGYPFCRGRVFSTIEKDEGQYDDERDIFWASGACFFIRKAVFDQVGGFDEDFFAHQEEIDLCWRLHNLGVSVKFTPFSVVYHVGGATLNDQNPQKTYLNFRNSLYMLLKNLPINKIFPIILGRLMLDGLAGIKFLFQGQFFHLAAIVKAHFSFYSNCRHIYSKRAENQSPMYSHISSIVSKYYLQSRKTYSSLF
jgi:GT2 family glycosyltransferase